LLEKSGQDFLSSKAGFPPRAGLIFLARRADFPNFTVTPFQKSVTVFSAMCDYFLGHVLLFSRTVVTALQTVCFYYAIFPQAVINQAVIVKYSAGECIFFTFTPYPSPQLAVR
jgi:hypothetical protein